MAVSITAVEPTVKFVRDGDGLRQIVCLKLDNPGKEVKAELAISFGKLKEKVAIGVVPAGETNVEAYFPDIQEAGKMGIGLLVEGKTVHEQEIDWMPIRHWTVYMLQRSHHDWGYTETPSYVLARQANFMDTVLDYCDQTDDFPEEAKYRYSVEAAWSIMEFLRTRSPEQIERCARRIKEGRIEITALLGNETTELCSHEELVRLLYPSFEIKHKFGGEIVAAEIQDIPGMSWGLVPILVAAGVKYISFGMPAWYFGYPEEERYRQFWDEKTILPRRRPDGHWWEGPDGSRVVVWHNYPGSGPDCGDAVDGFSTTLKSYEEMGYLYDAAVMPLSGGYTDNSPPTLKYSLLAREWNERYAFPKLIMATSGEYFKHIEGQLDGRVVRGDIPGTDYGVGASSTERECAMNRLTHDVIATSEKFATIASHVAGYEYPDEKLRTAYEKMSLYDEHTWGMAQPYGHAHDCAVHEKAYLAIQAASLAHDVQVKALNKIVDEVKLEGDGTNLVVFNPLDHVRTDVVNSAFVPIEPAGRPLHWKMMDDDPTRSPAFWTGHCIERHQHTLPVNLTNDSHDLIDMVTGKTVPYQVTEIDSPQNCVPYAANRFARKYSAEKVGKDLFFVADDVPAMGYKVYKLVERKKARTRGSYGVKVTCSSLENEFFIVKLDPKTGCIASIYDKELKRELVDPKAPYGFNQLVVRGSIDSVAHAAGKSVIRKGANGPMMGSLLVTGDGLGCPQRTQEITLYSGIKRVDLANRILKDSTPMQEVYFAFPFKMDKPKFVYESAGSVIEFIKDQVPGSNTHTCVPQHWVDVTDGKVGVTWTSREAHIASLGGFWPIPVSYAHHGVTPANYGKPNLREGDTYEGHIYSCVITNNYATNFNTAQTGDFLFRYSITSHKDGRIEGNARDLGWDASTPLNPIPFNGANNGTLPASSSFAQITPSNVMLMTIKQSEDAQGIIVRLMETDGKDTEATVTLPFADIARAFLTNPVEETQSTLYTLNNTVTVPIKANGMTTIRLVPKRWLSIRPITPKGQ